MNDKPGPGERVVRLLLATGGIAFVILLLIGVWLLEVWEFVWPRSP